MHCLAGRAPQSQAVASALPRPSPQARASYLVASRPRSAPLRRQASEQYFTSPHVLAHFFRQTMLRPQAAQALLGKHCLFPLKVNPRSAIGPVCRYTTPPPSGRTGERASGFRSFASPEQGTTAGPTA